MSETISFQLLLDEAADLLSEDNDNPEYDRAIVDLLRRVCGVPDDQHDIIASLLRRMSDIRRSSRPGEMHAPKRVGQPKSGSTFGDYMTRRLAEKRGACTGCGCPDSACIVGIRSGSTTGCCSSCAHHDTHPVGQRSKLQAIDVECPRCGAGPGERCHVLGKPQRAVKNVHSHRVKAATVLNVAERAGER